MITHDFVRNIYGMQANKCMNITDELRFVLGYRHKCDNGRYMS